MGNSPRWSILTPPMPLQIRCPTQSLKFLRLQSRNTTSCILQSRYHDFVRFAIPGAVHESAMEVDIKFAMR